MIQTPLQYMSRLSRLYKSNIYFKREDLQVVRSFKIRGAEKKIMSIKNPPKIVTASAGNHAQGVAHVCNERGVNCDIFIPITTPQQKIDKIQYFGGDWCTIKKIGNTFDESLAFARESCESSCFVHPFDDICVIEGQGTIASEIEEDIRPDIITCGVGGGGLISGLIRNSGLSTKIIGAECEGAAGMHESLREGKVVRLDSVDTFADGISVQEVGECTYNICKEYMDEGSIKVVDVNHICKTMVELYQYEGIITEPAGAIAVASLCHIPRGELYDKNVVCVISGGNNDITRYGEVIERALVYDNVKHYFKIDFIQRPGELKRFILDVMGGGDDITRFEYVKECDKETGEVFLGVYTKDVDRLQYKMETKGISYRKVSWRG